MARSGGESKPYVQRGAIWLAIAGASLLISGLAASPAVERVMIAVVVICLVAITVELIVAAVRWWHRKRT